MFFIRIKLEPETEHIPLEAAPTICRCCSNHSW